MRMKMWLSAVILLSGVLPLQAIAQSSAPAPEAKPLQAIPYSPSLDLSDMDRSVDACVDFYKFSCGGWQKNNPIPADQANWSVYGKLATENEQFLWGILEDAAKPCPDARRYSRRSGTTLPRAWTHPPSTPKAKLHCSRCWQRSRL